MTETRPRYVMEASVNIVLFVDEQFSEQAHAQYSSAWESAYTGCSRWNFTKVKLGNQYH